ncbi:alpha/beta fold hydrolase [Candidatus Leptofilum sp.]|uniref:alpha/beta fold hydrolase n=1 Tax=Candidatus Leptofilum sp. TaxID=3241576 RepID=UPI003B5C28FC
MEAIERFVDVGIKLQVREWNQEGKKRPFLLIHGLSSNARTWDGVARVLATVGHPVTAVNQRGHGQSDKPDHGYDFTTVTADLHRLIGVLGWKKPILAGQSWGGNVLLAFGAQYPGVASHLIFVDGGFLELHRRGSWEEIAEQLRPPAFNNVQRDQLKSQISTHHSDWSDEGVEATMHNFETLPDGTIRPWLTLEQHMKILRALYDQHPAALYSQVREPVLICPADDGSEWAQRKRGAVAAASTALPRAEVRWFEQTAHDIHVHRPKQLAEAMLDFID